MYDLGLSGAALKAGAFRHGAGLQLVEFRGSAAEVLLPAVTPMGARQAYVDAAQAAVEDGPGFLAATNQTPSAATLSLLAGDAALVATDGVLRGGGGELVRVARRGLRRTPRHLAQGRVAVTHAIREHSKR